MVFQLKGYQERCLQELAVFFQKTNELGQAKLAFYECTDRTYQDVADLPGLPYVCVRVPTGGGKTVMASHSVGTACKEFLHADRCLVLWLAPTTQIVSQTIEALRDKKHPYRQALDSAFGGNISIVDLPSALYLKPGTLGSDTTIVVSTMHAPRVGEKEVRKIYAEDNGELMEHFDHLNAEQIALLDRTESGKPAYSLANVFKLHRPIIIVDEAHNARTPLSFETLARFNPSCIIEFTATPRADSNILTHVSAAELKGEEMIKLPIRLRTRGQWKEAIQDALAMQTELEKASGKEREQTGEYIRPIVLFQAQRQGENHITYDVLKQSLLDDFEIPENQIMIATGDKNELEGIDVLAEDCEIRFIITVDKLREGWDCPFAYILCSVSNLSSRTAVEQVMGRVLRMPHARRKQHDELNYAYAYVTSPSFVEAANSLTESLIDSGFDKYEAQQSVKPAEQGELPLDMPLWGTPITETLTQKPDTAKIPKAIREYLQVRAGQEEDGAVLSYLGPAINKKEEAVWKKTFSKPQDQKAIEKLGRKSRGEDSWPAAMGETLSVPMLSVRIGKQRELFEEQFRDIYWKLSECDEGLSEAEFSLPGETDTRVDIDVKDGKIGWNSFTEILHRQLTFLDAHGPETEAELIVWLDRTIPHYDITQVEMGLYLKKVTVGLQQSRRISLEHLIVNRFRLKDALAEKIDSHRKHAFQKSYQQMLLPDYEPPLEANPEVCFTFPLNQYPTPRIYEGPIHFNKHYYEIPAAMNGEEAACAAFIDSLPEVECWVRNLERDTFAFWLQTSTDKFYPDFVAKLRDGRMLAVEYKGAHLLNADTAEKKMIGELWEGRSGGRCLFRLVTRETMEGEILGAVRKI